MAFRADVKIQQTAAANLYKVRGDVKIPHSRMTKNMVGNIHDLFVKCMRQGHLYHLLGYQITILIYRHRAQSVL